MQNTFFDVYLQTKSIYNVNVLIIYDMTKFVTASGINVSGSLKRLEVGESLAFPNTILETTIRVTCVRLKNATGLVYKVNRQSNGSHIVTRIS